MRCEMRDAEVMDDAEIKRLRNAICRSFSSSPHKTKYWLTLLEMHGGAQIVGRSRERHRAKERQSLRRSRMSGTGSASGSKQGRYCGE
jgi:hypothetical protein